jgi:CTP:phosphocholine cytidylyltransferase-like protein
MVKNFAENQYENFEKSSFCFTNEAEIRNLLKIESNESSFVYIKDQNLTHLNVYNGDFEDYSSFSDFYHISFIQNFDELRPDIWAMKNFHSGTFLYLFVNSTQDDAILKIFQDNYKQFDAKYMPTIIVCPWQSNLT